MTVQIERTAALRLTDVTYNSDGGWDSEQYEPLEEGSYLGIQDNGGEPDGNAWLIWPVNPLKDDVKAAIALGAELVYGYEAEYEAREFGEYLENGDLMSEEEWSGVGSEGTAFFVSKADAIRCATLAAALGDTDDPEEAFLLSCDEERYPVEVR